MKQIKDYLHLYYSWGDYYTGKTPDGVEVMWSDKKYPVFHCFKGLLENLVDECKLILRPLSDINREESERMDYYRGRLTNNDLTAAFELTRYLLSKGFDLFGLIDSGLAIDKTYLTPKTSING